MTHLHTLWRFVDGIPLSLNGGKFKTFKAARNMPRS
jgi:hypothetical protein